MANIFVFASLLLLFFGFLANNLNWSLDTMKTEVYLLDKGAGQYLTQRNSFYDKTLDDLKIGELE